MSEIDYNKLFTYLKNNEMEEFKLYFNNIIKSNENIDLNLRDDTNEYLLYYTILFNRLDLVKLLVENGAKIDIIDSEDRGILYLSIKYGYDKITEYLLEKNKDIIGINILDIKDKKKKNTFTLCNSKKKNKYYKQIIRIWF